MKPMRQRPIIANRGKYCLGDEDSRFKGFGGRKFVIKFFHGPTIKTTNLYWDRVARPNEKDTAKIFDAKGREQGWQRVGEDGEIYTCAFGSIRI